MCETELEQTCSLCGYEIPMGGGPWSICYDPEWNPEDQLSCGDTHEIKGKICYHCVEEYGLDR